jgi:MFS family permease
MLRHDDELGLLRPDHLDGASGRDRRLRGSRSALCTCDSCTKAALTGDFTGVGDQLIGLGDANAVTFVVYGALGGALFLLPVELQVVAHYSPLESGLALLPVTLVMLLFSARSGQLSARIGPRLQMSVGPVLVGAGIALLARATDPGSYVTQVLPVVLLFSAGLAITVAPLTATAMGAAPCEHSDIASAVNNTVARAAGLFAVAVLPLLAGLIGAAALSPEQLADGFRTAIYIAGAACASGGLLAVVTIRNPSRETAPSPEHYTSNCGVAGPPLRPVVAAATGSATDPSHSAA